MFHLVQQMHQKFGIEYNGEPRQLDKEEFEFRIKAFNEEINEYIKAYEEGNLEDQLDALIDLMVFALGACEKQGFHFVEHAFSRVMTANMAKERVANASESKRGHAFDLKKPEGWRAPYFGDLLKHHQYKGIIILDGPDGCGKTTLAETLQNDFGAHVIHSTWSPELNKRMDTYLTETFQQALDISSRQLVVLDRLWLSELVYADVYRGGSPYHGMHEGIDLFCEGRGFKLVYCLPENLDSINSHFNSLKEDRDEMYSDISEVIKCYATLWSGKDHGYTFKATSPYLDSLLGDNHNHFGNPNRCGIEAVRYDWTTDGKNIHHFICTQILSAENINV